MYGVGVRTYLKTPFDGDTGSGTSLMTEEAIRENEKFLSSRQAWVAPDGSLRASAAYDTIEMVVANMTGRYDYQKVPHQPTSFIE